MSEAPHHTIPAQTLHCSSTIRLILLKSNPRSTRESFQPTHLTNMRRAAVALLATASMASCQSMDVNNTAPEIFFLDLAISDVQNGTANVNLVQPWAELYKTAIVEQRYGDAVYAR